MAHACAHGLARLAGAPVRVLAYISHAEGLRAVDPLDDPPATASLPGGASQQAGQHALAPSRPVRAP